MLKEIVHYPLTFKGCSSTEFEAIKNPYNGDVLGAVAQANDEAIQIAICVAQNTYHQVMKLMPAHRRADILNRTAQLIAENHEELARTIALEGGKPVRDARLEVTRAINTFSISGQEALNLAGEQIPMDRTSLQEGKIGLVLRESIGVVCAITPFNFPLNLVAHKLGPAIAAGNTVVLKPSSQTPITSFKLFELLKQAGLPEGALNIVPCRGNRSQALVTSSKLAMLTFTGSPEIGWHLRKSVAPGVRIILELGGNAGVIVHEDANLKMAAQAVCRGGYVNAGQSCISVQRVYVHKNVYDQFMEIFLTLVKVLKLGDPLHEDTDVGPLINATSAQNTLKRIDEAVKAGAKLLLGGKSKASNLIEPTVLTDTTKDMQVISQEVFAPVVSVMRYETIDQAIDLINDARWGLQAGIFTNDLDTAFKAARKIDVGGVMVNDAPTFRADHQPYGGRKESGLGLEGVRYALAEMTQPKFVCLNLPKLA